MVNSSDFYYQIPNKTTNPADLLFTTPNQYTEGAFINIWLFGVYGVFFIGATLFSNDLAKNSLFASFVTFITTFLLVLLSGMTDIAVAGGNQLIPAIVILLANLLWNYMKSGGKLA